ncbi:hypothetical protein AX774_g3609 [Zancudomyces culisetae]|uniref:Uncharacterized protein n=1 Tax=Zancudomyces culisetae TaxID=1213189 RepID=A0A1R1PPK3_ZANCU|nr:hypothetical protein AX774_g5571 [Zancudomyces culisetae]OMH82894.1 hypothetical protein AX774_g3609 [Zancudomyces culisetae]|eukprot:OMH80982.1 hypothetical protein AX774_g5571 [Zancudomyces culisetae]
MELVVLPVLHKLFDPRIPMVQTIINIEKHYTLGWIKIRHFITKIATGVALRIWLGVGTNSGIILFPLMVFTYV